MKRLIGNLLGLGMACAVQADMIVDYQHTAGSTIADELGYGITSSSGLDGSFTGTVATSIDQLSGAKEQDLPNNAGTTYQYYFSYTVQSAYGATYESVDIDTAAKVTTRVFKISYLFDGNETFLTPDWVNAALITDDTRTALTYDFTDFHTSDEVEFRVYWGGDTSGSDLSRVYVDKFTLSGAIPEPATVSLIAMMGLSGLFIRRRFMS